MDKDGILTNSQLAPKNFYFFDDDYANSNKSNKLDDSLIVKTDYFPTKVSNRIVKFVF